MNNDKQHGRTSQLADILLGLADATAIFGGFIGAFAAPTIPLTAAVILIVLGYFCWIRRALRDRYGTPLPWDKEAWKEYNA